MCLSMANLPLTFRVVRIDSDDSQTHRTVHALTLAIMADASLIGQLACVGSLAVLAAMHIALIQYSSRVLLGSAAHDFIAML